MNIYYAPNCRSTRILFKILVIRRRKHFRYLREPAFFVKTLVFNFFNHPV